MAVRVRVLGATAAERDGLPVDLGTPKQRALLAALSLHRGRPVSVGLLEELLWGDQPPAAVAASMQAYVSGLRRALEPDRPRRAPPTVVVTAVPGYALRLPVEAVDADAFIDRVLAVQRALTAGLGEGLEGLLLPGADVEHLAEARAGLEESVGWWDGEPYADLGDAPGAVAERVRLGELLLVARHDLATIRLAQGEHASVAAELAALRHEHPLDEGLAGRQVLAEYRCGRQADALETLRTVRRRLGDELGVDPGTLLQEIEQAVLRQDPRLDWRPPGASARLLPATSSVSEPSPDRSVEGVGAPEDPRRWPLVGRGTEVAELCDTLDAAESGRTGFAVLVGEPGIGKTRLAEELAARAARRGFVVVTGRCSEDEGAPPLWPWLAVLRDLVRALDDDQRDRVLGPHLALVAGLLPPGTLPNAEPPAPAAADEQPPEARRFQVWDAVGQVLVAAAGERPVLVVLDDLHWADASTLRLLRHLAQTLPDTRLVVLATRRSHPEPAGALAELGDALARRHGLRVDLSGLGADDVRDLVALATGAAPEPVTAELLRSRTEGNPFFVVELVRWSAGGHRPAQEVPTAVADVVSRRVHQLPEATQAQLRSASVLGRSFQLSTLAAVRGEDEDDVLDALDPAVAAGVVVESTSSVGTVRFAHALVRDAVYEGMSPVRRARRHADAARVLAGHPAEAAHHWLAAGPAYAGPAWRTASTAAEQAERVFGHEEAAALLGQALVVMPDDPTATDEERYDLLVRRADACRWAADVQGLDACLAEAIDVAEAMGDYTRMARAAVGTTEGSLWSARPYGLVDQHRVAALEVVLRELPPGDGELRCRAMLSLANELFYGDEPQRLEALVEEGLAMARRLGDRHLLLWALQTAVVARWRARLLAERVALVSEAVALADSLGEPTWQALVLALHAATAQERGLVDVMRRDVARVRAIAVPRRLAYPLVMVGWMEVPWLAMAGRLDEAEQLFAETYVAGESTTMHQGPEVVFGALLSLRYWQGRSAELLPMMDAFGDSPMVMLTLTRAYLLAHLGRLDEARAALGGATRFPASDDWLTTIGLYQQAHLWVALDEPAACAEVYAQLAPYAGRVVSAGSAVAMGPVDATLARLAGFLGEQATAARHADAALAQCEAWGIPLPAAELTAWRAQHRF